MPDKRIDEQFINQAWEQMRTTLDREMPVEEKRRRIVLIPWRLAAAASVLLLLTIGAGWWLSHRSPSTTQTIVDSSSTISTQKEVDQSATKSTETTIAAMETAKTSVSAQKTPQNEVSNAPKEQIAVQAKGALQRPSITKSNKVHSDENQVESSTVQTLQQIADNKSTIKQPSLSESNKIIDNINIDQNEVVTATTIQNQSLEALKAQQIAMLEKAPIKLEEKKKVEFFGETKEEKESKNNKWNVGLEFATYTSAGAAVDGYAGGAVVDVPVESEKFNLRTGLNFNAQQRYFDSNVQTVAQADRGGTAGFGPSTVLIDPNPDLQVNAQQLSLPLTLEFKPRQSWGVEGGLQASYLLGARNLKGAEAYQTMTGLVYGNQEVKTLLDGLTNNDFTTSNAKPIENNPLNLDAFRRFDVALSAGFGYYPTTNIGVRLQYQRGLIDMLKADQFKTFGNNVRLSAVYFFGK